MTLSGHPSWKFLNFTATENYSVDEIRTFFMQEAFKAGLLVLSTHNVTLSHSSRIVGRVSEIYDSVFRKLQRVLENEELREKLEVSPLKPLFKVR